MKHILTIAGTDPCGAAGIQADLMTFRDFGFHGLSVITAVVAQNTQGVRAWSPVEPDLLTQQLDAIGSDLTLDAVKIGMLPNAATVKIVSDWCEGIKVPIVVDPVLTSGDGHMPLSRAASDVYETLLRQASVVTPNIPEARRLLGLKRDTLITAQELAQTFFDQFEVPTLLKMGHSDALEAKGSEAVLVDLIASIEGVSTTSALPKVDFDARGTGCHLASAIACGLGEGLTLIESIEKARRYLNMLLTSKARCLGKGRHVLVHA